MDALGETSTDPVGLPSVRAVHCSLLCTLREGSRDADGTVTGVLWRHIDGEMSSVCETIYNRGLTCADTKQTSRTKGSNNQNIFPQRVHQRGFMWSYNDHWYVATATHPSISGLTKSRKCACNTATNDRTNELREPNERTHERTFPPYPPCSGFVLNFGSESIFAGSDGAMYVCMYSLVLEYRYV